MSRFDTSTNHPIIPNAQEYTIEKKYVSIHSEDRNIGKFPNASDFEIELPQDYLNVASVKLSTWSFPSNYDVFSINNQNNIMTFQFAAIYNPSAHGNNDTLDYLIYSFLSTYKSAYKNDDFLVEIGNGFYNPIQMATELTNRFNQTVTEYISSQLVLYDASNGTTLNTAFLLYADGEIKGGYKDFIVAYNQVEQKLYFGNRSSSFSLTQNQLLLSSYYSKDACYNRNTLPDSSVIGLPSFIGINSYCPIHSITVTDPLLHPGSIPRFSYGSAVTPGDNGYWLTPNPDLQGCMISFVAAPLKLNNMGPAYFYLDIDGLNYMDETSPFNKSTFTRETNKTNGIVNASFAKIGITSTPLSQFYDNTMDSYKYYNPPAERIRKLKIRLRYHNGQYVDFNNFPFSFTLEFTLMNPQILRNLIATKSYTTL